MNGGRVLGCAAVAVAALLGFGSLAAADDVIVLRDGSQKRGALSACDQSSCRLGAESIDRTSIEWIGLDRGVTTPPAVRNAERDELHLTNRSVQTVTLTSVDLGFVRAMRGAQGSSAASSLPRRSVAWIHLGRPRQGATESPPDEPSVPGPKKPTQTAGPDTKGNPDRQGRSVRSDGAPWRLPSRIYTWHAPCPTCDVSLSVIDLRVEGGDAMIVKARIITVGANHLKGAWVTFDPPLPLFPTTTDVRRFAFTGGGSANVTLDLYTEGYGGASAGGGGVPTSAASPNSDPSADTTDRQEDPLARAIGQSAGIPEVWASRLADAWRDRMARDRAAAQGQGSAAPGRAQYRQHSRETGQATYRLDVRISNWPIIAGEFVRRRDAGSEPWGRLAKIPVYDVEVRLDLWWTNVLGQTRRVDRRGYTTDDSWRRGPGGPAPGPPQYNAVPEYGPAPYRHDRPRNIPDEPERQRGRIEEFLSGDPLEPAREAMNDAADQMSDGAERMAGEAMSGLAHAPPGVPSARLTGGVLYAVWLATRWSRADGRVSADYGTDIFRYIDGRPEPVSGWIVSATRPPHAFDLSGAPPWTPPNPKPQPQPGRSGGSWMKP
jgi:hypothetical protein